MSTRLDDIAEAETNAEQVAALDGAPTLAASAASPAITSLPLMGSLASSLGQHGSDPQDHNKWAWFGGSMWKEDRAVYEVQKPARYMMWEADFVVTKTIFERRTFTPIYIDNTRGVLVYGHTGRWHSKEATPDQIMWVEWNGRRVTHIWNRITNGDGWFSVFQQEARLVRTAEEFARHGESDLFLDEPAARAPSQAATVARTRWTRYQDPSGPCWWYRDEQLWFCEEDPAWKRDQEPESRRFYWRKPASPEVWFYEDTGEDW